MQFKSGGKKLVPKLMRLIEILILSEFNGFLLAGVSLNVAIKKRSQSLNCRIKFYFDRDMLRNSLMVHSIG